ncbi:MAG: hypothetical protein ABIQ66_09885 [Novosphingobium sp.]
MTDNAQDPPNTPNPLPDHQNDPDQDPVNIPLESPTYKPGEIEPGPTGPEIPPPYIPQQDPVPPQA